MRILILTIYFAMGTFSMSSPASSLEIVTIEQKEFEAVLKTPANPVSFPLGTEDTKLIDAMREKLVSLVIDCCCPCLADIQRF